MQHGVSHPIREDRLLAVKDKGVSHAGMDEEVCDFGEGEMIMVAG